MADNPTSPVPVPVGSDLDHRFVCTKDDPWSPEKGRFVEHPNAMVKIFGDSVDYYGCPNCGHSWGEELPE